MAFNERRTAEANFDCGRKVMAGIQTTCTVDTRELVREVIPALLEYGRRTLQEQCVTSATFIACRWQKGISFVDIATIDSELETVHHVTKSKVSGLGGLQWTVGMMIAVQRTNPNSPFSIKTGNRWPLAKPGGKRGSAENWRYFSNAAERMQSARHSSTHFLQTGVTPIIRRGLESPYYKYNPAFGTRREMAAVPNELNTVNSDSLGGMVIDLAGDDCVVTASSDVGEPEGGSNSTLAAKHRRALIEYGTPPLEKAVAQEVSDGYAELARRMELGWKIKYPNWS
jgi:hypothetical protein